MASSNITLGVEIIHRIGSMLNQQIELHGEIQINNKLIWKSYLHKMDNEVWESILETMLLLNKQNPHLIEIHQLINFEEAIYAIKNHSVYYNNVLDVKNKSVNNKALAWKCLMSIREIYNNCCDIDLPNSDKSKLNNNYGTIFN